MFALSEKCRTFTVKEISEEHHFISSKYCDHAQPRFQSAMMPNGEDLFNSTCERRIKRVYDDAFGVGLSNSAFSSTTTWNMNANSSIHQNLMDSYGTNENVVAPKPLCCKCKLSRCLKQYCECYRAGELCTISCECANCANDPSHEDLRLRSMDETRKISSFAFAPEWKALSASAKSDRSFTVNASSHPKGCRCRRSRCRKKYCECFQLAVPCTSRCECLECHNKRRPALDTQKPSRLYRPQTRTSSPPTPPPPPLCALPDANVYQSWLPFVAMAQTLKGCPAGVEWSADPPLALGRDTPAREFSALAADTSADSDPSLATPTGSFSRICLFGDVESPCLPTELCSMADHTATASPAGEDGEADPTLTPSASGSPLTRPALSDGLGFDLGSDGPGEGGCPLDHMLADSGFAAACGGLLVGGFVGCFSPEPMWGPRCEGGAALNLSPIPISPSG